MFLVATFLILTTVISVAVTIYVAYVANNSSVRKRLLAKHKAKNGETAYTIYSKVYTHQFVVALGLISLWQVLHLTSNVVEAMQQPNSIPSLIIGGMGLVSGLAGLYLASSTLKKR
jgi:hypothetical protein